MPADAGQDDTLTAMRCRAYARVLYLRNCRPHLQLLHSIKLGLLEECSQVIQSALQVCILCLQKSSLVGVLLYEGCLGQRAELTAMDYRQARFMVSSCGVGQSLAASCQTATKMHTYALALNSREVTKHLGPADTARSMQATALPHNSSADLAQLHLQHPDNLACMT